MGVRIALLIYGVRGCRTGAKQEPVSSEETYYFVPVAFRGDLKYLTQCFNFVRNASSAKARRTMYQLSIDPRPRSSQLIRRFFDVPRVWFVLELDRIFLVEIKVWSCCSKLFF